MLIVNRVISSIGQGLRRMGIDLHEARDPRVQAMQKKIREIGSIQFRIEMLPDGTWAAESVNLDGIITGGTATSDMNALIKDAVFTYFEIPPLLCNDALMQGSKESIQLERRVYA